QSLPCIVHVVGLQPHLLSVPPPPQVLGAAQVFPQSSSLPQPSDTEPHSAPSSMHVLALQGLVPQRFGPPPPQMAGCMHEPQSSIPPQWSGKSPQLALSSVHVTF